MRTWGSRSLPTLPIPESRGAARPRTIRSTTLNLPTVHLANDDYAYLTPLDSPRILVLTTDGVAAKTLVLFDGADGGTILADVTNAR